MRKKTKARRDAILAAAASEFAEKGYEGASMSAIVTRVGGSKQTLYSYFPSKDDLFIEVTDQAIDRLMNAAYAELVVGDDMARTLCRYGQRYLEVRQLPEMVALARLVFGEAGRTEIGRQMWRRVKLGGVAKTADFLTAATRAGKLDVPDPNVAAFHLFALFEAELVDGVVLRGRDAASTEEIGEIVGRAVQVFLAAYGG